MTVETIDAPSLKAPSAVYRAIGPEIIAVHGERSAAHPSATGAMLLRGSSRRQKDEPGRPRRQQMGSPGAIDDCRLARRGFDALRFANRWRMTKKIGVDTVSVAGGQVPHREALRSLHGPDQPDRVPALAMPVLARARQGMSIQLVGPCGPRPICSPIGRRLKAQTSRQLPRHPYSFPDRTQTRLPMRPRSNMLCPMSKPQLEQGCAASHMRREISPDIPEQESTTRVR